jgi:hypothetical protein
VLLSFSHLFHMATHVSPIPRSTVIWFGSLEFMSTGFGYDMILLSVRVPRGARIMPTRSKAPRWPHHHTSLPKRRHDQHRHRPTAVARSSHRTGHATVEGLTAPHTKIADTTASQQSGHVVVPRDSLPHAPLPPFSLLPHGLFATRRMLPFVLDNAATSLTRAICPGAGTCVERPLALPRNTETRQEAQQAAECLGFP